MNRRIVIITLRLLIMKVMMIIMMMMMVVVTKTMVTIVNANDSSPSYKTHIILVAEMAVGVLMVIVLHPYSVLMVMVK